MAGKKQKVGKTVATAKARFQVMGPRKIRYVADLIRGKTVGEAQVMLSLLHRPSAVPVVSRLLKSAVANSQHDNPDDLVVARIWADGGPTMKRWRPRAFGRSARIRKRMCHVTIELAEPVGGMKEA